MENEIIKKYTSLIMPSIKSGDKKTAEVYKLIKAKMMEFVTQKNTPVLDTKAEITLLNKMYKERMDTASVYRSANRLELALQEEFEASIIEKLLPKQASKEDIEKVVDEYIVMNPDTTKKDMGKVIKYVKEQFENVDGKTVSTIVASKLS